MGAVIVLVAGIAMRMAVSVVMVMFMVIMIMLCIVLVMLMRRLLHRSLRQRRVIGVTVHTMGLSMIVFC